MLIDSSSNMADAMDVEDCSVADNSANSNSSQDFSIDLLKLYYGKHSRVVSQSL